MILIELEEPGSSVWKCNKCGRIVPWRLKFCPSCDGEERSPVSTVTILSQNTFSQ
jgi:rubrerythrin